jgi:hypothetical protein
MTKGYMQDKTDTRGLMPLMRLMAPDIWIQGTKSRKSQESETKMIISKMLRHSILRFSKKKEHYSHRLH